MLRVAMLGAGSIVRHRHLPAWKAQPDAEIVALVDVREEAAEQVAREHGIPRWTTDYREVLANDDIDAIDVCLPHHLHAPIGRFHHDRPSRDEPVRARGAL